MDKGDRVSIIIYIVYGSRASAQKLTSNTELTRSHNIKNVLQHIELNISLTKSRLLPATSGSISLRKTVIPSEAVLHRKTFFLSKANRQLASTNPDLVRVKRIIRIGECEWCYSPFIRERCYLPFTYCIDVIQTSTGGEITRSNVNEQDYFP